MSVASTGSAPPEICSISLDQIQTDSGSQARVKVNPGQVHHTMVGRMLHGASCAKHGMRERTVRRGGTVYQMNLAAGETATTEQAPEPSPQAPPEHEPPDPAPGDQSVAHGSGGSAPAPTDPLGIPVPQERAPVFKALADFQEAKDLFGRLANLLDRIAQGAGGQLYRLDLIRTVENAQPILACPLLRASLGKLQAAEPYCCGCPGCHTTHPGRANPRCKTCTGRGWTTRAAYERSPAAYRDAVLRLRSGNAE